jgi:hypothetical protein
MELGTVALIGMILLGAALAWGLYQNSHRDKRRDAETEAATRELYDEEPETEPGPRKT